MIRLNGKKVILLFLAVTLCVTACVPAFASVGDRILMRYSTTDGYGMDETVQTVVRAGDGICVVLRGQDGRKFLVYKDPKGEPETYTMPDNREPNITQDENGSDIRHYEDVSSVFGWNGEIYALISRQVSISSPKLPPSMWATTPRFRATFSQTSRMQKSLVLKVRTLPAMLACRFRTFAPSTRARW